MGVEPPVAQQVLQPAELSRLQTVATHVFVHHALVDYVVRLVVATRTPGEHGLTDVAGWVVLRRVAARHARHRRGRPRAGLIRGRDYVLPQDVLDVAPDVLRHRLVLSYDAVADEVPVDHIISRVLRPCRCRRSPPGRRGRPTPAATAADVSPR